MTEELSTFGKTILDAKYLKGKEKDWQDIAKRVVVEVVGPYFPDKVDAVTEAIANREFMPGGRYLANAGGSNFLNNCLAAETMLVTRDGARPIGTVAGTTQTVLSRGEWVDVQVRSFGVQSLRAITLKRSGSEKVIYATGNHGWFVKGQKVETDFLRPGMKLDREKAERVDVDPSITGVKHGIVFGDGYLGHEMSRVRLRGDKDAYLLKFFPDYPRHGLQTGIEVTALPSHFLRPPSLRWDRRYLYGFLTGYIAVSGNVSSEGRLSVESTRPEDMQLVRDICVILGIDTYGIRWEDQVDPDSGELTRVYNVTFDAVDIRPNMLLIPDHAYNFVPFSHPQRTRNQWTVVSIEETDRCEEVFCAVVPETHEFALEDGIATSNCFLYRVGDSKEEIADFFRKGTITGMTGGGVGALWSELRPRGAAVTSNGGTSTGPTAFMQSFNEIGRGVVNGGSRRMAIWAGLHWYHPDVFEFMELKDWDEETKARKASDFSAYAPMDMTNISVVLDTAFFEAMADVDWVREYEIGGHVFTVDHDWAHKVYWTAVEKMLEGGEPGLSIDAWENEGENLRNPCCEITSHDDSDVCCLGSVNLARIDTLERLVEVTDLGTMFLLCGTLHSKVPHEEVKDTRAKNRRLGLGIMGLAEWLIQRGYKYEPNAELEDWLFNWAVASNEAAAYYADDQCVSRPVKVRAIAPTGTIGIIAETTTGIEPLFAAGYKRRYLDNGVWKYQYVVDATAQRMVEQHGVNPDDIETAADLANDPGRRLEMQAFVQEFVDHAISSTLNLPSREDQTFTVESFGSTLMDVLPRLRGVTVYPDGSRGGQPLNVVSYQEASDWAGFEYEEVGLDQACVGGACGI